MFHSGEFRTSAVGASWQGPIIQTRIKQMKDTEETRKENKREYLKGANKNIVGLRMTPDEKALLLVKMKEEGWENVTGYIKFKLFGIDPEKEIDAIIQKKDPVSIGIILKNHVMYLANCFVYYRYRYDKDMRQLYQEEGVNVKDWTSVTNKWHVAMLKKLEDSFLMIRKIAVQVGLEDFFVSDADDVKIDLDSATPEQLDAIAEKIMQENIAMGRPNTFE